VVLKVDTPTHEATERWNEETWWMGKNEKGQMTVHDRQPPNDDKQQAIMKAFADLVSRPAAPFVPFRRYQAQHTSCFLLLNLFRRRCRGALDAQLPTIVKFAHEISLTLLTA
jgi:hypothetical protein